MPSLQQHNAAVAVNEAGTAGNEQTGYDFAQASRVVSSRTQPATGVP